MCGSQVPVVSEGGGVAPCARPACGVRSAPAAVEKFGTARERTRSVATSPCAPPPGGSGPRSGDRTCQSRNEGRPQRPRVEQW